MASVNVSSAIGYENRAAFCMMSEMVDLALDDCRVVSVAVQEADWSPIQRAMVGLVPIGMSVVCSIRELVRLGYIPSAKILLRPLIERVVTGEYLFGNVGATEDWNSGWSKKGRPTLAQLLSAFENGYKDDWKIYQEFMVDDFNAVVHPNPVGDEQFRSPNESGQQVFWFETFPMAFEMADNVCAAVMMSAVFLASQAKRAFITKMAP
jgi:hypothetical protein